MPISSHKAHCYLLVFALALLPQMSFACKNISGEPPTEEDRLRSADVVFIGKVISIRKAPEMNSSTYVLRMTVEKWQKGSGRRNVKLVDHPRVYCGSSVYSNHIIPNERFDPERLINTRWRVFASKSAGVYLVISVNDLAKPNQ